MTKRYTGSCLCGQVTFDATGFSNEVAACHCTMCRKFHGAAFGTLVEVEGLRWNSGKELLKDYQGSNGTVRTFCSNIDTHIYTDYKACWYDPPDNIPNCPEGRGS